MAASRQLPAALDALRVAARIATTSAYAPRRRKQLPLPLTGEGAWEAGLRHLQPYPDRLLDDLEEIEPGPDARYEQRESVQLALVTRSSYCRRNSAQC